MSSGFIIFLLLSLMSGSISSLPVPENNGTITATDVSGDIERVNRNLGNQRGGPVIRYGDIAVSTNRNADPCTAKGCKWPKTGNFVYVPVVIPATFSSAEQSVIKQSLVSFHAVTCIRFVRRTTQRDYLNIYPGTGCWSYVGRQGGAQLISLQKNGCVYLRTAQHEVLHALGFHHEQVRSDRDNFVTILTQNIQPATLSNFKKVATNNLATSYDFKSVMHYGRYAFSKSPGKLPTILPKGNPNQVIGEALRMSPNDIARVNRLYQCTGY